MGREDPAVRTVSPLVLKPLMTLRTVCSSRPCSPAMAGFVLLLLPQAAHCHHHEAERTRYRVQKPAGTHRHHDLGRQADLSYLRGIGRVRAGNYQRAHQRWAASGTSSWAVRWQAEDA